MSNESVFISWHLHWFEIERLTDMDHITTSTFYELHVCVGGAKSYHVAVTLSRTVEAGIWAHGPQRILCLKSNTKLISSPSLSLSVSHTVADTQWKNSAFVVRYWKHSLCLRYVIVNNSCRGASSPSERRVSDLTHWCIFRHRRQEECELSFLWKVEWWKKNKNKTKKQRQHLYVKYWLHHTTSKLLIFVQIQKAQQHFLIFVSSPCWRGPTRLLTDR